MTAEQQHGRGNERRAKARGPSGARSPTRTDTLYSSKQTVLDTNKQQTLPQCSASSCQAPPQPRPSDQPTLPRHTYTQRTTSTMMRAVSSVAVFPVLLCLAQHAAAGRPCPRSRPQAQPTASRGGSFCDQILPHVNAARSQVGARPVRCSGDLDRAAYSHSVDQARMRKMTHTGSNGSSAHARIRQVFNCPRGPATAENVAESQPGSSAKHYFDLWINSPGHRANILNPGLQYMGVAVAQNGREWATQVFASC